MVAVVLLTLQAAWTPPIPPGRRPLPPYKGVDFRIEQIEGRQVGRLVNRTNRRIAWTTGGYMIGAFAQPIGGGRVIADRLWPAWNRPTAWTKTESFTLPAKGTIPWGRPDVPAFLGLRPGRYRVWETFYPAFETETWLTSNAVVVDVR